MNTGELMKPLKKEGTTFEPSRGKGGHVFAIRGDNHTVIPQHGGRKELC
jgi:predicted RNA binding protein YcfA (HicA-like mRNA interferase family)